MMLHYERAFGNGWKKKNSGNREISGPYRTFDKDKEYLDDTIEGWRLGGWTGYHSWSH
jgi:hypothetical protein